MMRRGGGTLLLGAMLCGCAAPAAVAPFPGPAGWVDPADPAAVGIDRYLRGLEAVGFSGAVLVARGDRPVLRRGYGLADRERRAPYTPATVQTMGSITKQVTAAAVLLLEQEGRLRTSDPLALYLDGVPEDRRGITLHHLLTHTSGLPDAIGADAEPIGAEAFARRAMETPLQFEPGASVGYSNAGYSLLGIVVERVSGMGYEDFVRERLLLPAGLASTGYLRPEFAEDAVAVGYRDGERWGLTLGRGWLPDGPGWNYRANGGMHTTVDDMHRWLRVLRGSGPLGAEAVAAWTADHVAVGEGVHLGYGWVLHDTPRGRLIAHTGGSAAYGAAFGWLPEQDLFYYVHGNTSHWPAGAMEEALLAAAFDPALPLPPELEVDPAATPALAASRAGAYRTQGGGLEVVADDTRLRATPWGQRMLDAALGHDPARRPALARATGVAERVVERLAAGREDALEEAMGGEGDVAARGRSLARLLARYGEPREMTVVGTVANTPGGRTGGDGGATTLVRVEYGERTRVLSLLWRADGTYAGAALGPLGDLPLLVLVPVAGGGYRGVEREPPWRSLPVALEDGCLVLGGVRACREGPSAEPGGAR